MRSSSTGANDARVSWVFFFQAEDGIRDVAVTGVQTCALPIWVIEVVPLAYMRGRTLNNAFVILDEAQNATTMQMKMFLTRIGNGSKAIVTGDMTQIDLPGRSMSGLVQIQEILQNIEGISMVYFNKG